MPFRPGALIVLLIAGVWFWVAGRGPVSASSPPSHSPAGSGAAAVPTPEAVQRVPTAVLARLTHDQMVQAIREDRYCTGEGYTLPDNAFPNSLDRLPFLYEALVKAGPGGQADPCVQALITRDRALSIRLSASSDAAACRFILALTLTGQMRFTAGDPPPPPEELERGMEILRALHQEDAANGVYPFFLAGAMNPTDYTSEKGEAIRGLLQSDHFENPIAGLWASAYELADLNASANLYTAEVVSAFNFPIYAEALRATKDYVANIATADTADSRPWTENLVRYIKKVDSERIQEPFVTLADLGIQRALAKSFWQTAGREEADLPEVLTQDWYIDFFNRVTRRDESELFPTHDSGCLGLHREIKSRHISSMATFWDTKRRFERAFR